MTEQTVSRLADQLAGDGWLLLAGGVRLGQVTYAINIFEVSTLLGDHAIHGQEFDVRLMNHSVDAGRYAGQLLTLVLHDGRALTGFISDDGAHLVRTGAIT